MGPVHTSLTPFSLFSRDPIGLLGISLSLFMRRSHSLSLSKTFHARSLPMPLIAAPFLGNGETSFPSPNEGILGYLPLFRPFRKHARKDVPFYHRFLHRPWEIPDGRWSLCSCFVRLSIPLDVHRTPHRPLSDWEGVRTVPFGMPSRFVTSYPFSGELRKAKPSFAIFITRRSHRTEIQFVWRRVGRLRIDPRQGNRIGNSVTSERKG